MKHEISTLMSMQDDDSGAPPSMRGQNVGLIPSSETPSLKGGATKKMHTFSQMFGIKNYEDLHQV